MQKENNEILQVSKGLQRHTLVFRLSITFKDFLSVTVFLLHFINATRILCHNDEKMYDFCWICCRLILDFKGLSVEVGPL